VEFSLFAQEHRIIQLSERKLEIVKALDPANSRISHIFNSSKRETYSICSEFFENIFLHLNIQFAKIEQYSKNVSQIVQLSNNIKIPEFSKAKVV